MDTFLFFGFTAAYAALLVWGCALAARRGWFTPANLALLVIAGLVYDNFVLATGRFIGEGELLESLSFARFWIHALVTPLLAIWAWHAVRRAGVKWARSRASAWIAVLFTLGLIVLEFVTVLAGLRIEPTTEFGVLSYSNAAASGGPPLMVLFVAAALLVASFYTWRRQGWIWLLVGTGLMLVGSAVPLPLDSGAVTNAFELVLLVAILATKARQDNLERKHEPSARIG